MLIRHSPLFAAGAMLLSCAPKDVSPHPSGGGSSPSTQSTPTPASTPPNALVQAHETALAGPYEIVLLPERDSVSHLVQLRIQLIDRANRQRVIEAGAVSEIDVERHIRRADTTSILIDRLGDYGRIEPMKVFLDPASKRVIKKIEFSSSAGLGLLSDEEVAAALGIPLDLAQGLREPELTTKPGEPWDSVLPPVFRAHPMPQPSYSDFARARPDRVNDGYDSANAAVGEDPTAFQFIGNRAWFGKRFYDGEGLTGIGGVGYLDTTTFKYTFLQIPEVVGWSVSALLVDNQSLWIGLVGHPEGMDYSGDLLRHDLVTRTTVKIPVEDVIRQIRKWHDRIYVSTVNGIVIVQNDRVVERYLVEPDINEKYYLVRLAQ